MRLLQMVPADTKIPFLRLHKLSFVLSAVVLVISIGLFFTAGLNFGIDFRGGTLIEIKTKGDANIPKLRSQLGGLGLGDVQIQEFGAPSEVLIRIEQQPGGEKKQQNAIKKVKASLGEGVEYRRVEVVGPKVSGELIESGIIAVISAILAVLVYIWFRFEWQFSVGRDFAIPGSLPVAHRHAMGGGHLRRRVARDHQNSLRSRTGRMQD